MSENHLCSRRMFLLGTATTFAGAVLAACGTSTGPDVNAQDVPVGEAKKVGDYIIAQPTAGVYKAYSATCPHQGSPITKFDGLEATCTKHGSVFDTRDGHVLAGPSRAPLKEAKVTKEGDKLQVSG